MDIQGNKLERIFPTGIPPAIGPYSPVTKVGDLVFVSGQIPVDPLTGEIEAKDIEGQTHQVMKNLSNALTGAGCSFSSTLKTTILLTDMSFFAKVNEVYGSYFEAGRVPARVCFAVAALPKASLIEIECIATPEKDEHIRGAEPEKKVKKDEA